MQTPDPTDATSHLVHASELTDGEPQQDPTTSGRPPTPRSYEWAPPVSDKTWPRDKYGNLASGFGGG